MLSELDHTLLVVDLDPQANLTAAFLDEDTLAEQHGVRLSRPVKACDRWARQMPAEYSRSVLNDRPPAVALDPQAESIASPP